MALAETYAKASFIRDEALDRYASRGAVLSRDASHNVIAALQRDAAAMRERGGMANILGAERNEELAKNLSREIAHS